MTEDRYSDYDRFAWVYNKHWSDFGGRVLPVLEELVLKNLPAGSRILDLCCGTGQLAQELIARGFRVDGLDGSEEMIRFARENAPDAEFIVDDARFFKLPHVYHGVISTFDSLNHIMNLEELTSVFRNVYAVLQEGGLFLFDLNMEEGYESFWEGSFGIVEDDHVCVVCSNYRSDERIAQFDATIFYLQEGWQRMDLTLMQKCYSEEEVRSALEAAGFTEIRAYAHDEKRRLSELTDDEKRCLKGLTEESERAFFVCRKPVGAKGS